MFISGCHKKKAPLIYWHIFDHFLSRPCWGPTKQIYNVKWAPIFFFFSGITAHELGWLYITCTSRWKYDCWSSFKGRASKILPKWKSNTRGLFWPPGNKNETYNPGFFLHIPNNCFAYSNYKVFQRSEINLVVQKSSPEVGKLCCEAFKQEFS